MRGLKDKDFFTWEPGEIVYKNAYLKPQRGARSLVQCNESLLNSALLTVPVGNGLVTLCQLLVGEKAGENAAARTLLLNAIDYSAAYKLEGAGNDSRCRPGASRRAGFDQLAVRGRGGPLAGDGPRPDRRRLGHARKPQAALGPRGPHAGLLCFRRLARLARPVPEGLADYNRIVGFPHMIRPFRRERVTIAVPRSPLLSGVSLGDVALYSSERMFAWQDGNFVASDTFSQIVDLEDVAPFGQWNNDFYRLLVCGMTQEDGFKYIINHPVSDAPYQLTFDRPQEIVAWTWDGNTFYDRTSKVDLIVNGDEAGKRTFDVPENGDAVTLALDPPMTGKTFSFRHAKYTELPEKKRNGVTLVGCDNIRLFARRPADFRQRVSPLLNVGGLVAYPRGKGGILLCNLLFKANEELPVNGVKKRNVLASLLRNLGAPFGGGQADHCRNKPGLRAAGTGQAGQPVPHRGRLVRRRPLHAQGPAHRRADLRRSDLRDNHFRTSPVPTCIMLGGAGAGAVRRLPDEVKGIPVGKKADAHLPAHGPHRPQAPRR